MLDLVFVFDLSSKSISAQNESCRSFLPLQLLFWPNFKFLYEILSFIGSNRVKNRSKSITVLLPVLHCDRTRAHAGDRHTAGDLHVSRAPANLSLRTTPSLSAHEASSISPPLLLPRARVEPSLSRATAGANFGRPSLPQLDSSRPDLPRLAKKLCMSR